MLKRSTFLFAALVFASAAPAIAQGELSIDKNQTVYDSEGKRVAKVTRVMDDGSVLIIYKGKAIRLGADTLSMDNDKLATSLSRTEIARLD